jgi:hypothetical protein
LTPRSSPSSPRCRQSPTPGWRRSGLSKQLSQG